MEITAFQFCFTTSSTANSIDKCRRKLFVARGSYTTTSKRIRYIIEALGISQSEGAGNCSEYDLRYSPFTAVFWPIVFLITPRAMVCRG